MARIGLAVRERPGMNRVKMLDKSVAERIAAGEVVERPGSVVKELIENALDAGACHIRVELDGGGIDRLRVSDDGHGMSESDTRLGLQRFATSKIREWEDLDSLATLGFRGEALPSIAAVSHMEIVTKESEASAGFRIRLQGGEEIESGPVAAALGTQITVENLFFNTPARKKFLKSPVAEATFVIDLVSRLALTQPKVQFQVISNGREVLMISHRLTRLERLATVWKIPVGGFVPFSGEVAGITAEGYVALPHYAKANRNYQLFSLNGRVIRSQTLSQAILEGFGPMMTRGKYPVAFVQLTVDPAMVDVNVHPTKAEVRFADAKAPFRAIYRSIASALEGEQVDTVDPKDWVGSAEPPETAATDTADRAMDLDLRSSDTSSRFQSRNWEFASRKVSPQMVQATLDLYAQGRSEVSSLDNQDQAERFNLLAAQAAEQNAAGPIDAGPVDARPIGLESQRVEESRSESLKAAYESRWQSSKEAVEVLTQLDLTFILARVGRELWIIDQHTAHERVWYERLAPRITADQAFQYSQGLLVPEVIEWSPATSEFVAGNLGIFAELGFELEPFGGHAFQLRTVPHGLKAKDAPRVIHQVVEEFVNEHPSGRSHTKEMVREKCRAMVSCKSAVKAGDPLSKLEMQLLVEQMLAVEHSLYCPHGRPTRIKLDRGALDRLFHRT